MAELNLGGELISLIDLRKLFQPTATANVYYFNTVILGPRGVGEGVVTLTGTCGPIGCGFQGVLP